MPCSSNCVKRDAFVSPEYITESMPKWVEKFEYTELDANHWAVLSQPEKIADYIRQFIVKNA